MGLRASVDISGEEKSFFSCQDMNPRTQNLKNIFFQSLTLDRGPHVHQTLWSCMMWTQSTMWKHSYHAIVER